MVRTVHANAEVRNTSCQIYPILSHTVLHENSPMRMGSHFRSKCDFLSRFVESNAMCVVDCIDYRVMLGVPSYN